MNDKQTSVTTNPHYRLIGGEAAVRLLVERFYALMDALPEARAIRALHEADLTKAKERLFMFLSGWLGGPPLYAQRFGPPRLRQAHLPFPIGVAERDAWMLCMGRALDEVVPDTALRAQLMQSFFKTADFLRNTESAMMIPQTPAAEQPLTAENADMPKDRKTAVTARAAAVLAYHERTKHHLQRYAAGPETLDWTAQPDPFREYRGTRRVPLPLPAAQLDARYGDLYVPAAIAPQPLWVDTIGGLLQLSMAISAWKEYGPDRWALRCSPSSGNLHPTEAYVIARRVPGLADGVYHYASRDHALEQRGAYAPEDAAGGLWIGLSSIHWREAWKYGERAFRYCQHDIGHALGALRYAAGTLGWALRLVDAGGHAGLAALLGLDRDADYGDAEREEPDLLVEVLTTATRTESPITPPPAYTWTGQANRLDPHPMYRWPMIDEVAAGSRQESTTPGKSSTTSPLPTDAVQGEGSKAIFRASTGNECHMSYPPLPDDSMRPAASIVLNRRSAQRFDAHTFMDNDRFYRMLDALLPRRIVPWDVWPHPPRLHPVLFVHRVEGLEPGVYALPRRPEAEAGLRAALSAEFAWQRVAGAPQHLPLSRLLAGDCRAAARTLSCHQAIASDGCFALSMLGEFEELVCASPWHYRTLHWEAGLLGQVLYLEAEVAGLRGTGIGCYFDDAVHEALGLRDSRFQALYHFTVGDALTDTRITTLPAYPGAIDR